MTNGSLMKVESIAEWESDCFTQVLHACDCGLKFFMNTKIEILFTICNFIINWLWAIVTSVVRL